MSTVPVTKACRPVPTLLGGSGRVRTLVVRHLVLPALLRPLLDAPAMVPG